MIPGRFQIASRSWQALSLWGAIFENFFLNEIQKLFLHNGQSPPLYFWRDSREWI
jgi:predicted AAA+ superfamily ATPase